jgi:hypothetical protein
MADGPIQVIDEFTRERIYLPIGRWLVFFPASIYRGEGRHGAFLTS